jgi:hypothetical protein
MLVYGDIVRRLPATELLREIREDLQVLAPGGPDRLVGALIGLGELAQGVADVEHARAGLDHRSPAQDALNGALLVLAQAI